MSHYLILRDTPLLEIPSLIQTGRTYWYLGFQYPLGTVPRFCKGCLGNKWHAKFLSSPLFGGSYVNSETRKVFHSSEVSRRFPVWLFWTCSRFVAPDDDDDDDGSVARQFDAAAALKINLAPYWSAFIALQKYGLQMTYWDLSWFSI